CCVARRGRAICPTGPIPSRSPPPSNRFLPALRRSVRFGSPIVTSRIGQPRSMDPFALDIALPLARGLHLAAMLSTFGALVFAALIAPALLQPPRLGVLTHGSAALASVTALLWLTLQSGAMAGASSPGAMLRAVPVVLGGTHFGTVLVARLGL